MQVVVAITNEREATEAFAKSTVALDIDKRESRRWQRLIQGRMEKTAS